MLTLAIANQKGGSGKTTTTVNLAACLAEKGKRILVIDLDPQAQTTTSFGVETPPVEQSIYALLLYKNFLGRSLPHLAQAVGQRLMLVPSAPLTLEREKELVTSANCIAHLGEALREVSEKYDVALIDCPPSLGILTHTALWVSEVVLLTIETSFFALHGVGQLLSLIQSLQSQREVPLKLFALATLFDRRTNLAKAVLKDMRHYFQEHLLNTVIRVNSPLREACSFGKPITVYSPRAKGCEDYCRLAEELLEKTLSLEAGRGSEVMDEITLFTHCYGHGEKTARLLKGLGLATLAEVTAATAKQLSTQGRIPLREAERLIEKAKTFTSVSLVAMGQTLLLQPVKGRDEGEKPPTPGISSEVTPEELAALTGHPESVS